MGDFFSLTACEVIEAVREFLATIRLAAADCDRGHAWLLAFRVAAAVGAIGVVTGIGCGAERCSGAGRCCTRGCGLRLAGADAACRGCVGSGGPNSACHRCWAEFAFLAKKLFDALQRRHLFRLFLRDRFAVFVFFLLSRSPVKLSMSATTA